MSLLVETLVYLLAAIIGLGTTQVFASAAAIAMPGCCANSMRFMTPRKN